MPHKGIRLDKNGVKVVRFFMDHPEREMTSDEISRSLKIDDVDAGIIMNGLEKAGFLRGNARGLTYKYRISEQVLATQINTKPENHEGNHGNDDTRYIG
jgi:hypothetical protein